MRAHFSCPINLKSALAGREASFAAEDRDGVVPALVAQMQVN